MSVVITPSTLMENLCYLLFKVEAKGDLHETLSIFRGNDCGGKTSESDDES